VRRGFSYGATDDLGYKAVEKVTTIYDLHATILHLLGLAVSMQLKAGFAAFKLEVSYARRGRVPTALQLGLGESNFS
jgi:hypothetical protein